MEEGLGNVKRRVSLLKETLRLVAEILAMIPERREVIKSRPELRHKEGYFDNGMIQRGTEKVFLMGPPLVDGPRYTALTQCLADRLSQCKLEFHDTYNLPSEMIGEARLIKEPVWRACMEGLKMTLDWELTEAEAATTIEDPPAGVESPGERSAEREDPPAPAPAEPAAEPEPEPPNILPAGEKPPQAEKPLAATAVSSAGKLATDVVDSDYAESILKSDLAILFNVDRATIARRIQSGALRALPGTLNTAKKVRIHGDDFPLGLKRTHERQAKLSPQPKSTLPEATDIA